MDGRLCLAAAWSQASRVLSLTAISMLSLTEGRGIVVMSVGMPVPFGGGEWCDIDRL